MVTVFFNLCSSGDRKSAIPKVYIFPHLTSLAGRFGKPGIITTDGFSCILELLRRSTIWDMTGWTRDCTTLIPVVVSPSLVVLLTVVLWWLSQVPVWLNEPTAAIPSACKELFGGIWPSIPPVWMHTSSWIMQQSLVVGYVYSYSFYWYCSCFTNVVLVKSLFFMLVTKLIGNLRHFGGSLSMRVLTAVAHRGH